MPIEEVSRRAIVKYCLGSLYRKVTPLDDRRSTLCLLPLMPLLAGSLFVPFDFDSDLYTAAIVSADSGDSLDCRKIVEIGRGE